jgi:23S rRNA (guanosine2251-2'-O)-methyltransferase
MSPRFERRPDRRSGSGARGSARPAKPTRFSPGARSEWRSEWRSDRPARSDGERPSRPGDRQRPGLDRAPRFQDGGRESRRFGAREGRSEGGWEGGRGRSGGSRVAGSRPRFGARLEAGRHERRDSTAPQGEAESLGDAPASDLIWGRHAAQAALESGRPVHRIWCTAEMRHSPRFLQLLREAKASGVLVEEVTWARLGQLTGGAVHQGIVLQSAAAETLDLPSLIEGCSQIGEPPLLMAIDGLTDPHNLGAIVRSAEALGAHGMVLPQRRSAGLTGSVAKVAAGALEHLPVARVVNLNRALDTLKKEGYRVVGLAAEGTATLEEADLAGPLVVVTGSEGEGLSLLTRRSCDQLVRIPLRGATPSLNASVATALLLYEIARRGWMRGLSGQAPAPRIQRPQLPTSASEPAQNAASDSDSESMRAAMVSEATPEPLPEVLPEARPEALPDWLPEAEAEEEGEPAAAASAEPLSSAEPEPAAMAESPMAAPWTAQPQIAPGFNQPTFSSDISL